MGRRRQGCVAAPTLRAYKIQTIRKTTKSINSFDKHCVLSHLLDFEAATINALVESNFCSKWNFRCQFYFENQIADFLSILGQGYQRVIFRPWCVLQFGFGLVSLSHSCGRQWLLEVCLGGAREHISGLRGSVFPFYQIFRQTWCACQIWWVFELVQGVKLSVKET